MHMRLGAWHGFRSLAMVGILALLSVHASALRADDQSSSRTQQHVGYWSQQFPVLLLTFLKRVAPYKRSVPALLISFRNTYLTEFGAVPAFIIIGIVLCMACLLLYIQGPDAEASPEDTFVPSKDKEPSVSTAADSADVTDSPGKVPLTEDIDVAVKIPQRPSGITCLCCGDGLLKLSGAKTAQKQSEMTCEVEPMAAPAADAGQGDIHPDFSGTWKCVKSEGELDEFFRDIGVGYAVRCILATFSYGAGKVTRIYEHNGTHMKMTEKGGPEDNVQEWDVNGEEQIIDDEAAPFLMIPYYDVNDPRVLIIEGKDVEKKNQSTWTTSRQFFVTEDSWVVESKSSYGHVCRWIYEREVGK